VIIIIFENLTNSRLCNGHLFQPIAVDTLSDELNTAASSFLTELGREISAMSGNDRESGYLFQRISVLIQRCNAVLSHQGFFEENRPDVDH